MSLSKLWRKPTPTEMLEDLIANTEAELETAEMQEILMKAKLHTATESVAFYRQHLKVLKEMLPESVASQNPA